MIRSFQPNQSLQIHKLFELWPVDLPYIGRAFVDDCKTAPYIVSANRLQRWFLLKKRYIHQHPQNQPTIYWIWIFSSYSVDGIHYFSSFVIIGHGFCMCEHRGCTSTEISVFQKVFAPRIPSEDSIFPVFTAKNLPSELVLLLSAEQVSVRVSVRGFIQVSTQTLALQRWWLCAKWKLAGTVKE